MKYLKIPTLFLLALVALHCQEDPRQNPKDTTDQELPTGDVATDTAMDTSTDTALDTNSDTAEDTHTDTGTDTVADTTLDTSTDTAADTPTDTDLASDTAEPVCVAQEVDGRLVHGDAEPLVRIDPGCGRLSYGRYAAEGQSARIHHLPDFSIAGYQGGGVAIPDVPTVETLSPPASGDSRAAIQAAIDAVAARSPDANGFRGALLLRAGTYYVSDALVIAHSGVVIRGEGQGADGTRLIATRTAQHDLIRIAGTGSGADEVSGTRQEITSAVVPVGALSFTVASTAGFSVGDSIGVQRTPNELWITELGMDAWGWTASAYAVTHPRRIVAIAGDRITIDIPIVDAMEAQYGGGRVFLTNPQGFIEHCGVEDLRLESLYSHPTDEDHAWNAVTLTRAQNAFVRRVTALHFGYSAVSLSQSHFNTIEEVAQLDPISEITGGRRYSFNINSGTGNLFTRCFARNGRHNFVTGARVAGPNVWLDSVSVRNHSDEGPHHRWSTGLLFDNLHSAHFNVQNRQSSGTGHGWAGAQTLFWNVNATAGIICDAPKGAMNWTVGSTGTQRVGSWDPDEAFGWWESHDTPVLPRSLYLAQLEDRLGRAAVEAVTLPAQRDGTIYALLNGWAGQGALADAAPAPFLCWDGILNGQTCCAASCGTCGGTGCGGFPGGAANCCIGTINDSGRVCGIDPPPCVLP